MLSTVFFPVRSVAGCGASGGAGNGGLQSGLSQWWKTHCLVPTNA